MAETVKIEGRVETEALLILERNPGFEVDPLRSNNAAEADIAIRFADQRRPVAVHYKQRLNTASAWQFVHHAQSAPEIPLMVVAEESTAESRVILARHGIGVVDGLGNAHVELPGLLLHIEAKARSRSSKKRRPVRLRGKSGVVAQALMLQPNREWKIKNLANEANISEGLVHRVLTRLEDENLIATEGAGPYTTRHVVDPGALLDLWAEEESDELHRTLGFVLAQTPRQLIEKLSVTLGGEGIEYALTGAAAASLIAPFITAVPLVELWVTMQLLPENFLDLVGGEPVDEGANVAILQQKADTPLAFRERIGSTWVSNRLRIYVDLVRDPRRGREQADHLRAQVIDF